VIGVGKAGVSGELVFKDYLDSIKRPTRSFIHYNNWYSPDGKTLTPENFVKRTYLVFKEHLEGYGVALDAMVPDDGWQNRKSIYEPNPAQFPGGIAELMALSEELENQGTHLGLWIALNGYNSDIDWGTGQGFIEAKRNDRFKKFKRYYSITDPKYFSTISQRLKDLITRCRVRYFKHDFNELCDLTDNTGHLPTDRHGHEASVDCELALLKLERELNPEIYQNVTNWIWFSPWWLAHTNNLWMLSSDTGEFNGIPEISALVRAAAYRDVHLYKIFHDPETRPLVPISNLMTHGIIYTRTKYGGAAPDESGGGAGRGGGAGAGAGGETLQDFNDYLMMYYTRGTQLKEWYIDPQLLSDEQWQALGRATRWSEENLQTLANAVKVGGDPAKGEVHGYIAWLDDHGILSLRNPSAVEGEALIPFDQSVWYRGPREKPFRARMIYPWQGDLPMPIVSGHGIRLKVPAYTLVTVDIRPSAPASAPTAATAPAWALPAAPAFTVINNQIKLTVPDEEMRRADLVVILKAPPRTGAKTADLPGLKVNGEPVTPTRSAAAQSWSMITLDLRAQRGQALSIDVLSPGAETYLILDRPIGEAADNKDARLPLPTMQGFRRQSIALDRRPG